MYLSISIRSFIKCCFVTQMAELGGHSLPEKEFICTFFLSNSYFDIYILADIFCFHVFVVLLFLMKILFSSKHTKMIFSTELSCLCMYIQYT